MIATATPDMVWLIKRQSSALPPSTYWSGVPCGIGDGGLGIASTDGAGGIGSPDGGVGIGSPDCGVGDGIGARDDDVSTGFCFRAGAAGSGREDVGILSRISWLADCSISLVKTRWCTRSAALRPFNGNPRHLFEILKVPLGCKCFTVSEEAFFSPLSDIMPTLCF